MSWMSDMFNNTMCPRKKKVQAKRSNFRVSLTSSYIGAHTQLRGTYDSTVHTVMACWGHGKQITTHLLQSFSTDDVVSLLFLWSFVFRQRNRSLSPLEARSGRSQMIRCNETITCSPKKGETLACGPKYKDEHARIYFWYERRSPTFVTGLIAGIFSTRCYNREYILRVAKQLQHFGSFRLF